MRNVIAKLEFSCKLREDISEWGTVFRFNQHETFPIEISTLEQ